MTKPDPYGLAVRRLLLQAVLDELDEQSKAAKRETAEQRHLIYLLANHPDLPQMAAVLLQGTVQYHNPLIQGMSPALGAQEVRDAGYQLKPAHQALASISTNLEMVSRLVRVAEVLLQAYDNVASHSRPPEDRASLVGGSYCRLLDILGVQNANPDRHLEVVKRCYQMLIRGGEAKY